MALSTDELDYMIAQAPDAVTITYGSPQQSTTGVLDRDTVQSINGEGGIEVVGDSLAVTIRAGTLTSLLMDSDISVGGTTYKIRDIGTVLTDGTRRITLAES